MHQKTFLELISEFSNVLHDKIPPQKWTTFVYTHTEQSQTKTENDTIYCSFKINNCDCKGITQGSFLEVMELSYILIVVVATQIYTFVKLIGWNTS